MKKYFGTDGIRGIAGSELTGTIAAHCGNSLTVLKKNPLVLIGKDTRRSGDMLLSAFSYGVTAGGGNVIDIGIVSTPAVAYLVRELKADYGVVLSASHNPPEFNGIKIFGGDGYKIPDTQKDIIEDRISKDLLYITEPLSIGRIKYAHSEIARYTEYLIKSGKHLDGMKIVLDCSNGAVYDIAPNVFASLGADVIAVNREHDGERVNMGCGALHPETAAKLVVEHHADIGFSFDGDADRIMAIDEKGNIVDGDSIIYIFAKEYLAENKLTGKTVVGTLHTNLGAEKALMDIGVGLVRTDVGDQHVLEKMLEHGYVIGGEQSGHIILSNHATTGDGVLTAVILASRLVETHEKLSELNDIQPFPQENRGIIVEDKEYVLGHPDVQDMLLRVKNELKNKGRILLRASGTEPKIRVMVECENQKLAKKLADEMTTIIERLANDIA